MNFSSQILPLDFFFPLGEKFPGRHLEEEMASKRIYTREQLLLLQGEAVARDPSEHLRQAAKIIQDTTETPAAKPLSRYERHQEKQKAAAAAAAAAAPPSRAAGLFDKFAHDRAGEKGAERGSSGWRGDKDRETFEEGYLYELRESAKQRRSVESALAEVSGAKTAQAASSEAPPPVKATEVKPAEEDSAFQEDDAFLQALNQKPRVSRFFSGGDAAEKNDDLPPPETKKHVAVRPAALVEPVDIAMPSSTVVWNQRPAAAAKPAPAPQKQSAPPAAPPASSQQPSQRQQPQALPKAAPANAKVITAADLESQLFSQQQQKAAKPPASANAVMGTFDAALLEQQLLAKTQAAKTVLQAQPAPVPVPVPAPQHQPLPVPQAPFSVQPAVRLQYPQAQSFQQVPMRPASGGQAPLAPWGVTHVSAQTPMGAQAPITGYGYYPAAAPVQTFQQAPVQVQGPLLVYPQQQVYGYPPSQVQYVPRQ